MLAQVLLALAVLDPAALALAAVGKQPAPVESSKMSSKFSDRQKELLRAAAQREDRLLPIPPHLKGGAAQKVAAKLVAAGLAKEVKAKAGAPIWRRDTETERAHALKLTALGAKTVAADVENVSESVDGAATDTSPGDRPARRTLRLRSDAPAPVENAAEERRGSEDPAGASEPFRHSPRLGSKLDRVLGTLSSDRGATLDELTRATGWLPHTARAALTGLRKRGYDVRLIRGGRETASVYRLTTPAAGGAR
jgi:hypothetical protein